MRRGLSISTKVVHGRGERQQNTCLTRRVPAKLCAMGDSVAGSMRKPLWLLAAAISGGAVSMSGIQSALFAAFLFVVAMLLFLAGLNEAQLRRWRIGAARMFILLSGLVGFTIFAAGAFILGRVEDEPSDRERTALLERYRHFVENSEAPNKTSLIELTNVELKVRGANLYGRIKTINSHYSGIAVLRQDRLAKKEISPEESGRLWQEEKAKAGEEFEGLRVEARMILVELRNRIPYEARKHIVGLPSINPADKRAGSVSLHDVFPSGLAVGFSDLLAREIEELVKLLPDS
jgi:hypothetical protein